MPSFRHSLLFSIAGFAVVLSGFIDSSRVQAVEAGFKDYSPSQIAKLKKEASTGNQALKARKLLAIYYFEKKKYSDAIEILTPVQDGLDKQAIKILSKSYAHSKNYLNQIRVLEQWLSRNQRDYSAIKELGDAYLAQGNRIEAAKTFQLAIQINRKYEPAYEALMRVNEDEGNVSENLGLTRDMLRVFGEKKIYLHRLCENYYSEGFLKEARGYCQRAVARDPKFAQSHVVLGLTYREEQNPQLYQRILSKAARQFPKSELAQYMAGQMSEDLKDVTNASKYYLQATKADPESVRSWLRLGVVGISAKNYEQSLKAFAKACDLDRSKALEPFRTAVSMLRSQGVNQWHRSYDDGVQKCKYQNTIVRSSRVKDFTIKEPAAAPVTEDPAATPGAQQGTGTGVNPTPGQLPATMTPLPTSGSSPDGTITPTESTGE